MLYFMAYNNNKKMKDLQIHNSRFITYLDDTFTVDILGGVDLQMMERMVCTLRISHQNFPPFRTTLDLYNDDQTDKLIRTLCDKWELKLIEVSKILHRLILELETYRLEELKYTGKTLRNEFILTESDRKEALKLLKSKDLVKKLTENLNTTGIIGEDENAIILFMALASHKFSNPFSVLCLAKSGIGKSYILQKLSECMPVGSYSFHTQISANALYYFNSQEIQNKALLIEDLEWTTQMLTPLSTLQSQGKLVKTRATKNKDGMMHSTTFEVTGNLCLLACAYSDKNYESLSLPFLMVHLNHSHSQDIAIMNYQKKLKAGLIKLEEVKQVQYSLKCVIASLENVNIINPFAELINLPEDVAHPRKSLLLLLNFIEVITYFFQHQREQVINEETGEVFIKTAPEDIKLAFKLLKNSLFRRADELSTSARGFYHWLNKYLEEAQCAQFTALDIRKAKSINPRTLNRYLQELKLYSYIQVTGGNKHREGFIYKLTQFGNQTDVQTRIEKALQTNLEIIQKSTQKPKKQPSKIKSKTVSQTPVSNSQTLQA
jgi:DNA-binding HxlR family transcriptional regulator